MFCPDCGSENVRGQKFCARCGSNLLVIDRAREIPTEYQPVPQVPQINPSTILKVVALVSTFGLATVTAGTLFLMLASHGRGPVPLFFGVAGLASIVFICRYLLRLLNTSHFVAPPAPPRPVVTPTYVAPPAPPVQRGATNRRLSEQAIPYHSVVEERTRQFEDR